MAKKKNQSKKHKFKYADPSATAGTAAAPATGAPAAGQAGIVAPATAAVKARPGMVAAATTRDFSYVSSDLRRIAVLAVVLVGVEVALWLLFSHTGVGNQVYNLVRV